MRSKFQFVLVFPTVPEVIVYPYCEPSNRIDILFCVLPKTLPLKFKDCPDPVGTIFKAENAIAPV